MGDVEMERQRPKHRHPKKRPAKTVKALAKLLSELHQLRAQLQKAEMPREHYTDAYSVLDLIRKSSIRFPDLSCAVSQRGCFPRPDHVCDGSAGFLNFGRTFGYGRRSGFLTSCPTSSLRRFSSAFFSAWIFAVSSALISSWSVQSSSADIHSKSLRFMTVPNHDMIFS